MDMFLVMGHLSGGSFGTLNDKEGMEKHLAYVVKESGFTLMNIFMEQFQPYGVTGVAVIGESHIAIHTWPENGMAFLEVCSCSSLEQAEKAFDLFAAWFGDVKVQKTTQVISPPASIHTPKLKSKSPSC